MIRVWSQIPRASVGKPAPKSRPLTSTHVYLHALTQITQNFSNKNWYFYLGRLSMWQYLRVFRHKLGWQCQDQKERCTRRPETSKLKKLKGLEPWSLSGYRHALAPSGQEGTDPQELSSDLHTRATHTFTKQIRTKDDAGGEFQWYSWGICGEGRVEGRCLSEVREQEFPTAQPASWFSLAIHCSLRTEGEGRGSGCGMVQQPEYQQGYWWKQMTRTLH